MKKRYRLTEDGKIDPPPDRGTFALIGVRARLFWVVLGVVGSCAARSTLEAAEPDAPAIGGAVADRFEHVPAWPVGAVSREYHGAVSAIDVDATGKIWVVGRSAMPVRIYDAAGNLVRSWGEGVFIKPHGLGFDADGNAWISDIGDHTVRKFTPEGKLLRTLGEAGKPGTDLAHFDQPTDIAVGPDHSIYVADGYGNNRVVHFDPNGRPLGAFGSEGTKPGEFRLPHALAFDSCGRLYVADRSNGRIQVFDRSGKYLAEWSGKLMPWDLWISPTDDIFACGSSPMRPRVGLRLVPAGIPPRDQIVVQFDRDGQIRSQWTFPSGRKAGAVDWVHGLSFGRGGELYLGDIQGQRVQKFKHQAGRSEQASPLKGN